MSDMEIVTPVMSEFKTCKNLASWFKTCKVLARILQDINQGKKNKSGYKCCRKHLWGKLLFIEQITKPNSIKKIFSPDTKSCKNLARILQVFEF